MVNEKTPEWTIKDLKRAEEELKRASSEMIEETLVTPDRIYLDLALLKNYHIGAVVYHLKHVLNLSNEQVQEKLDYIKDAFPKYITRHFHDIERYFPKLGVSNKDIENVLKDISTHGHVFLYSPVTQYVNSFKANLDVNANHSHVGEKFTKRKINDKAFVKEFKKIVVTLNTYPLTLSHRCQQLAGLFMSENFGVDVLLMNIRPKEITPDVFMDWDEIDTAFFKDFLENESFRNAFTEIKMQDKRIFAASWFGDVTQHGLSDKYLKEEMVHIAARIGFLTNFAWIEPQHLGPFIPTKISRAVFEEMLKNGG